MRPKLDSMILHLASGIAAKIPLCTHNWGFGNEIIAKSVYGRDVIWFAPAFFTAAGMNPLEQSETIIHELSHIALNTNDKSFSSLQTSIAGAGSILTRDGLLPKFLNSAYFWEGLDNGATTPAMLNAQLLQFVFRAAGTAPLPPAPPLPMPKIPGYSGYFG